MINAYESVLDTNLVVPLGVDRTEVIFDYYFAGEGGEHLCHRLLHADLKVSRVST